MERSRAWKIGTAGLALALAGVLVAASAAEAKKKRRPRREGACTTTARLQLSACYAEAADDHYTTKAFCVNEPEERGECLGEAREASQEAVELCGEQFRARKGLCRQIGEDRYAPDMDPELFQDPRNPTRPNPYFPLDVGNRWVYEEDGEMIVIEILDATKRVGEIDCIVYRDTVTSEGLLVEDTDDWFALRTNGDVEYCGEEVKDYEYFEGDDPEVPELTEIEGRFKAGVDLAKSGTAFPGAPEEGRTYRQEWDPGNAEDIGTVLSTHYAYGENEELDAFVPEELARLMCPHGDCVVILDGSTLDPGALEHKYYARGIGKFLEVKPEEGEIVPLVECNVDARCDDLPVE